MIYIYKKKGFVEIIQKISGGPIWIIRIRLWIVVVKMDFGLFVQKLCKLRIFI
jgi:hypothetical protein